MPIIRSLAVIILFAPLISLVKSEDACALNIQMSDDMSNFVDAGREVGNLLSGKEANGKDIAMGVMSYYKTLLTVTKSIPKIGEFIEPLSDLFDMFAPKKPSQELQCMAQEFKKIDQRLVAIEKSIQVLNRKIDQVIALIEDKANQNIAQQLFNRYNDNKAHLVHLASVYRRFIKNLDKKDRADDLLRSCINIDLYYRLEWIKNFITEDSPGADFLPTLVAASNCKDQDAFYLTTAAMIAEDIKEIVYFDRVCEGIRNRSDSTQQEIQEMIEIIKKTFLTFEKSLGEKCILKNIEPAINNYIRGYGNRDPTQGTVDMIYDEMRKSISPRWFLGVFAFMSNRHEIYLRTASNFIETPKQQVIYNHARAKLIENQAESQAIPVGGSKTGIGKTDFLIVWKHETETTDFWRKIDSKFPTRQSINSTYQDINNYYRNIKNGQKKFLCYEDGNMIRNQVQAIAGAENLIASLVGVCRPSDRMACEKIFSKTDQQVARQLKFPVCSHTYQESHLGTREYMIRIMIGYF